MNSPTFLGLTVVEWLGSGTLTVTAIIAVAAWRSVKAATIAAEAAENSSEAQLAKQFLEEHSSADMH